MTAIANQSPLLTRRVFAVLVIAVILLASASGCETTYEYDKKRVVIFTFGVGLTFISDKEAEIEAQTKESSAPGKKGE